MEPSIIQGKYPVFTKHFYYAISLEPDKQAGGRKSIRTEQNPVLERSRGPAQLTVEEKPPSWPKETPAELGDHSSGFKCKCTENWILFDHFPSTRAYYPKITYSAFRSKDRDLQVLYWVRVDLTNQDGISYRVS